jgi:hypothetical protein
MVNTTTSTKIDKSAKDVGTQHRAEPFVSQNKVRFCGEGVFLNRYDF